MPKRKPRNETTKTQNDANITEVVNSTSYVHESCNSEPPLKLRKLNEGDTSSLRLVNNDNNHNDDNNNDNKLSMLCCLPEEIFNHICSFIIESSRSDYPEYLHSSTTSLLLPLKFTCKSLLFSDSILFSNFKPPFPPSFQIFT